VWYLDEDASHHVRPKSGASSTVVVASTPGFADEYLFVAGIPTGPYDRYAVFLRRDLPGRDAIAAALLRVPGAIRQLVPSS